MLKPKPKNPEPCNASIKPDRNCRLLKFRPSPKLSPRNDEEKRLLAIHLDVLEGEPEARCDSPEALGLQDSFLQGIL